MPLAYSIMLNVIMMKFTLSIKPERIIIVFGYPNIDKKIDSVFGFSKTKVTIYNRNGPNL